MPKRPAKIRRRARAFFYCRGIGRGACGHPYWLGKLGTFATWATWGICSECPARGTCPIRPRCPLLLTCPICPQHTHHEKWGLDEIGLPRLLSHGGQRPGPAGALAPPLD